MLFPHVRATPDWTQGYDHGWPQHLFLEPSSPLISTLDLPPGFDVAKTPLVSFYRVDTLLERGRLDALYRALHPDSPYLPPGDTSILSDEALWNLAPAEYMRIFTAPRPEGNFGTMVVSTAGHWTTHLFSALSDPGLFANGIENVVAFFPEAMRAWAYEVQALLDEAEHGPRAARRQRQVVVRAYLPGHEDCHEHREPIANYTGGPGGWWNWNQIGDFNRAFEVRPRVFLSPPCYVSLTVRVFRTFFAVASTRTSTFCPSTAPGSSAPTHMLPPTACTL